MPAPITEILQFLDTKDDTLRSMISSFKDCATLAKADELIKDIKCKEAEYSPDFRAAAKRPFCSICYTAAYYVRGRHSQALRHLEDAERGFNCSGQEWNLAMARWMHALLDQSMGQNERAKLNFEAAGNILKRLSYDYRRKGRYETADECGKLIEMIRASTDAELPHQLKASQSNKQEPKNEMPIPVPVKSPSSNAGTLIFPVFDPVCAGTTGHFIFDSEPQGQLSLGELTINEKPFRIYSLKNNEPVFLHPRIYRWMLVTGDSMNQAHPYPLNEGDCLLIVETDSDGLSPRSGDIVVAALLDPSSSAERAGVVKRYSPAGLRSESSQAYPSIPFKKVKVKGIVLAVAKPLEL